MENLWAPWRMNYILGDKSGNCIFCSNPDEKDSKENLVLYRGKLSMVMMNKYPYTYSHLLVAPGRHVSGLDDLETAELNNLSSILQKSIIILKEAFQPHGFNIGLNQGKDAGAGIEEHLHFHIVPRWSGDINFMPLLSETRVIPEHLNETYDRLAPFFKQLDI
ncbi:MAG: HIT domain-containing protein [Pseudomonadota bacterium]